MAKRYIILELLEPMEGSEHPADSNEALDELFGYLENEFNNQGLCVHMQMLEEEDEQ